MTHNTIRTNNAPEPGNYSQGRTVDLGNYTLLYTSGQTGNDPKTDNVISGGIIPQTRQALENIRAVVEAAGGRLEHVVDVTVFLENMVRDKPGFESVYREFFQNPKPARALVEVSKVPLATEDTIVEIKAVAAIPKG